MKKFLLIVAIFLTSFNFCYAHSAAQNTDDSWKRQQIQDRERRARERQAMVERQRRESQARLERQERERQAQIERQQRREQERLELERLQRQRQNKK